MSDRSGHGLYLYSSGNRYKGQYLAGKKVNSMVVCHLFKAAIITKNGVILSFLTSDPLGGFWSVLVDDWSPCRRKVCRTVCCWKEVIVIIIIIMITLHFKGRARAATTLEMVMFSQVPRSLWNWFGALLFQLVKGGWKAGVQDGDGYQVRGSEQHLLKRLCHILTDTWTYYLTSNSIGSDLHFRHFPTVT